jgi:gamma-glutamyl-gamma-aminobutyrate hydrolase PuuD
VPADSKDWLCFLDADVALAPDGTVEAFVHRDFPQWGIFWHPEREPRDNRDAQILQTLFG